MFSTICYQWKALCERIKYNLCLYVKAQLDPVHFGVWSRVLGLGLQYIILYGGNGVGGRWGGMVLLPHRWKLLSDKWCVVCVRMCVCVNEVDKCVKKIKSKLLIMTSMSAKASDCYHLCGSLGNETDPFVTHSPWLWCHFKVCQRLVQLSTGRRQAGKRNAFVDLFYRLEQVETAFKSCT